MCFYAVFVQSIILQVRFHQQAEQVQPSPDPCSYGTPSLRIYSKLFMARVNMPVCIALAKLSHFHFHGICARQLSLQDLHDDVLPCKPCIFIWRIWPANLISLCRRSSPCVVPVNSTWRNSGANLTLLNAFHRLNPMGWFNFGWLCDACNDSFFQGKFANAHYLSIEDNFWQCSLSVCVIYFTE